MVGLNYFFVRTVRRPQIWKRYGVDTFVILSKYVACSFLVGVNRINEAIQFSVEIENENGELPFFDCLIERNSGGSLDTTVYKKPTSTGRFLNFHSCHSWEKQGIPAIFEVVNFMCIFVQFLVL